MTRKLRLYLRERPHDWQGYLHFLVDHGFYGVIGEYSNGPWMRHTGDIHKAGLKLGVSPGFPMPAPFADEDGDQVHEEGRGERALRLAVAEWQELGADELHPDWEPGYQKTIFHRKRRQQGSAALRLVQQEHPGIAIVCTSYPSFPIETFAAADRDCSVQVYDRKDDQSLGSPTSLSFAALWIQRWRAKGFRSTRAGVGTYKLIKGSAGQDVAIPKTLQRQRAYLESFPAGVDGDVWTSRLQQVEWRTAAAHYAELRRFAET